MMKGVRRPARTGLPDYLALFVEIGLANENRLLTMVDIAESRIKGLAHP